MHVSHTRTYGFLPSLVGGALAVRAVSGCAATFGGGREQLSNRDHITFMHQHHLLDIAVSSTFLEANTARRIGEGVLAHA
jgi:hypothetical protein